MFSGIGGLEEGLRRAGHEVDFLCEIDDSARNILATHFAGVQSVADIRTLKSLPSLDVLAAGFPCQDLSPAGRTEGISGARSGLVAEVFRLLRKGPRPRWVVLENVPFMLRLDRGRAIRLVTAELEALGFRWAYRVIDTRAFGIPQRRERVILLASKHEDPCAALLGSDAEAIPSDHGSNTLRGFYWTEGNTGLGWAVDAIPPLKGGSGVGIPSPPAIWFRGERRVAIPDIRDAERLQGFPEDWTATVENGHRRLRWRLVGNAVSVPLSEWIGNRLLSPKGTYAAGRKFDGERSLPPAAWGQRGQIFTIPVSSFPIRRRYRHLHSFLKFPTTPLSYRAASGFLDRATNSRLRFEPGFLAEVEAYVRLVAQGGYGHSNK